MKYIDVKSVKASVCDRPGSKKRSDYIKEIKNTPCRFVSIMRPHCSETAIATDANAILLVLLVPRGRFDECVLAGNPKRSV